MGYKVAHFIHSRQTYTHMVSESPGTPIPRGLLFQGGWYSLGRAPQLGFHTCLQKQLPRQIQGTEGQTDGQEEEVALQTYRDRKERGC